MIIACIVIAALLFGGYFWGKFATTGQDEETYR